ncbi:MAG: MFS transporter, partial [Burkholderiales bacterium]
GVAGRVVWGYIADRTRNSLGVLQRLAATTTACCLIAALIAPGWPMPALAILFIVFGAAAVGWNGLFLAEVARCSPRGMVSVATSAAMTWNFGGILIGPALFATVYQLTGSYTSTYALLSVIGLSAVAALSMCRAAGRRERAAA